MHSAASSPVYSLWEGSRDVRLGIRGHAYRKLTVETLRTYHHEDQP